MATTKRIQEILEAQEFLLREAHEAAAAGITIELTIGADTEEARRIKMNFGIYSDVQGILDTLNDALHDSAYHNIRHLKEETMKNQDYINNLEKNSPHHFKKRKPQT
jgi:hypothetical protein